MYVVMLYVCFIMYLKDEMSGFIYMRTSTAYYGISITIDEI